MDFKTILKYVAIAGGIYVVWEYIVAPMMNSTPAIAPPASGTGTTSGTSSGAAGGTGTQQSGGTQQQQPQQCPQGYTGTYPNCVAPSAPAVVNNTFTSSDYGTANWLSRVAAAMGAAAGAQTQNFDNWSFYYQNQANGSPISANLMQNIINAGTAGTSLTRASMITAPQFLLALTSAGQQNGLSGMGDIVYVGNGLGNFWGVN